MAKLKLKVVAAITILMVWSLESVIGDPQQNLLSNECSDVTVNDLSSFNRNLNVSFAEMRAQVSNHGKYFATAQSTTGTEPVYAMFQCMNYVSVTDCAACFDAAAVEIRNCSAPITNGARVVYDGCFLRYESSDFFGKNILPGNNMRCGHQIAVEVTTFSTIVQQILKDLQIAIPKISGFFANTKTKVADIAIYIVAQCAETFKQDKCLNCLSIQHNNLKACLPNTNGWSIDPAGCFTRYSDTPFFADNQTTDISPFLKQGGSSSKKWVIFPGTVGGVILVVILLSLFFWHRRSQSPKRTPRDYALGKTELKAPTKYKYSDLKAATRNFSEKNKLGEGGFGVVYKGVMRNGKTVAIKKLLSGKSNMIDDNFESEVTLISNVHHKNLVRLLGCCSKGHNRILVYEYMANNSLDTFLFGTRKGLLNWRQRYDIILGTARGLAYLHEEFHVSIIHRDIKSGNILLDEEFQPKISDFGLVKLLPGDQSHVSTRFVGTLGYTAPEYALHGQLSEKADTYSYGIVVLEIISGQKCIDVKVVDDDGEEDYLLRQVSNFA